jgi:3-hydroxybutyryl-CoA dehydratase
MNVVVDDPRLELFAAVTGDRNLIHVGDAHAAGTLFGGRIAHGLLSEA